MTSEILLSIHYSLTSLFGLALPNFVYLNRKREISPVYRAAKTWHLFSGSNEEDMDYEPNCKTKGININTHKFSFWAKLPKYCNCCEVKLLVIMFWNPNLLLQ